MALSFLRESNLINSFLSAAQPEAVLLLTAVALYLVGLLIGRILKRQFAVGLGWTYQIFIAGAAIVSASALFHFDYPGQHLIGLVALFFAAFPLNALLYRYFWPIFGYPGEQARIPPFLPQITTLLLIATTFFTGLSLFYGVTLPGLLAGSGLIALVLGLALQDTLGNIFAGLGLQAGKAFRVGDWLILDGKHVEVVKINWRSTRLRNLDAASFDIPNNQLAKASWLFGISKLAASKFRRRVDRQLILTTSTCFPSKISQSPTRNALPAWRPRPANILPSVSCRAKPRTRAINPEPANKPGRVTP